MTDLLPHLIRNFVVREVDAAPLLAEFRRGVASATRSYPDAWFSLGRKTPEAVDDLSHRVFTVCARVSKGRYPFMGRVPFLAYVEEHMDGSTIRYHSFYAKLSITREILREDYASNLVRNPVLRWRAQLYDKVGAVLREHAEPVGASKPPMWRPRGPGLSRVRPLDVVEEDLRVASTQDVSTLVLRALRQTGPISQSRLTALIGEVVRAPAEDPVESVHEELDPATTLVVRQAVVAAWAALDLESRALLVAVARGEAYDSLLARFPAFRHKVALTRAVQRCNETFLSRVAAALGQDTSVALPPQQLAEAILDVLVEILPELQQTEGGAA